MFCEKCGTVLSDDAKFCSKCGTKLEKKVPEKVFCTKCGKQYPRTQLFCTNCGNRLDISEEIVQPTRDGSIEQSFGDSNPDQVITSISYAVGEVTGITLKIKQGSLLLKGNQIEVYKVDNTGFLLGGALGGAIIGAVEGAKLASGGSWKRPDIVIPYTNIVRYRPGKFGANKSIILNLNNCTSYTFIVANKQDQILTVLRGKCPQCEAVGIG